MDQSNNHKILYIETHSFAPYVRVARINAGNQKTFFVPTRIIYDYEIIFILEGEMDVISDGQKYTLVKHDLHIMSPFIIHKRIVTKGFCRYYNIHFDCVYDDSEYITEEFYNRQCGDENVENFTIDEHLANRNIYRFKDFNLPSKLHINNPTEYIHIFEQICKNFSCMELSNQLRVSGYMQILISMIFDSIIEDSDSIRYVEIIEKCQEFISSKFNSEIDLVKLANENGFSVSHFRRIFKKITHLSPHSYVIECRMNYAYQLLETGNYTVTQVSYMVGYDNPLYFSRAFKAKYNIPPSEILPK